MQLVKFTLFTLTFLMSGLALAEESEFKGKIQEDLDGYIDQIETSCGIKVKAEWSGGKLGFNPRESEKPEWNAISTLCTQSLSSFAYACSDNAAVKSAVKGVKKVACTKGKGTLTYKKSGDTMSFSVDQTFLKNNVSGQGTDLATKLKKDLDS